MISDKDQLSTLHPTRSTHTEIWAHFSITWSNSSTVKDCETFCIAQAKLQPLLVKETHLYASGGGIKRCFCLTSVVARFHTVHTALQHRNLEQCGNGGVNTLPSAENNCKKGKASSLDIAPLTILNSGALQPRKWQLTANDCSTAAHAVATQSPR